MEKLNTSNFFTEEFRVGKIKKNYPGTQTN